MGQPPEFAGHRAALVQAECSIDPSFDNAGQAFVFKGGDTDGDGLPDVLDPDPTDPDSDGDGIVDGSDPDFVAAAVADLPFGVFRSARDPAGQRTAMLSILADIEAMILGGDTEGAIILLRNLRRRVDGCPDTPTAGEMADRNDWIINCDAQREIRALIDLLVTNLSA